MSLKSSIYDDCCLLTNIDLNSERIYHLLERRFKSNSTETSFDFKSFLPEQPSTNTKVSRSLLRCQPKTTYNNDDEDSTSSDTSSTSPSEDGVFSSSDDDDDDDRLNKLAEWEPGEFQPIIETDDDDDEEKDENVIPSVSTENNEEEHPVDPMDFSPAEETPTNPIEDLLVTFIHRPLKTEPISNDNDYCFDNPPQLDGQIDCLSTKSDPNDTQKRLDDTIARISAKQSKPNKTIQLYQIPTCKTKFRLNDDTKKKTTNQTPRRSFSKIDRPNELIRKEPKPIKKAPSRLLSSVLKANEDVIRPLQISLPSNSQKSLRLPSDSRLQTVNSKTPIQRKSLSIDEGITSQAPRTLSLISSKQKCPPQNPKASVKSKEKSASDHMTLAEKKLNYHFQKHQQSKPTISNQNSTSSSIKPKPKINPPKLTNPKDSLIRKIESTQTKVKKLKRLNIEQTQTQPKKQKSMGDYYTLISSSSVQKEPPITTQRSESSIKPINDNTTNPHHRPADFFKGCIIIDDEEEEDDNDIQEIERQHYSISHNIRSREKLLDHIVHSSIMHVKWLLNLDSILLEHISIYHENNLRSLNHQSLLIKSEFPLKSSIYQIDPSFISTIIINFLKLFILRNSSHDQENVSFMQFGLTSHLRYLLIELPTYNHFEEQDLSNSCSQCHQYSLIINILFDLLFDLIEYDLCQITSKMKYRSSLIEDDYFARFSQTKFHEKPSFYRMKLLIYFIELIGIHMKKCSKTTQFQFNRNENKLFHSIEDFIRHILSHLNNSMNQRISICFNVMELCLLFASEKESRIKQMALFLTEICENNFEYMKLFLFEKNLFTDIRLLLINELISKKFNRKFLSIDHIQAIFSQIQENFISTNSIDEVVLLLLRSLFNTYADLILEIKEFPWMYSNFVQELRLILYNQMNIIYRKLIKISLEDSECFQKLKSTLFFYRLLKCKWNKL